MDSLELDPPSLGDNMASPYTGSNRKLSQSMEYHSDTIIVNDPVTSRVRKRTFRFASCLRFNTAYGRVPPGPTRSGEIVCGPAPCWIVDPYGAKQLSTGRSPLVKNFSKEVAGWLTARIGPV